MNLDLQITVLSTILVKDHHLLIKVDLYLAVGQIAPPPSFGTRFPRLTEKLSPLLKERAVEDALLGEEGEAVKLECQEYGKEWLRPAGGWEQCG